MPINFEDIDAHARRIFISGRLDIAGTADIEMQFTSLAASAKRQVLVDLTQVSFLASIGIRALVSNAKAVKMRGGKMVLFTGNNDIVAKTLHATGIDQVMPIYGDIAEAEKAAFS